MHYMTKYYALSHEVFVFMYTSNRPMHCTLFYNVFYYYYYYKFVLLLLL